MKSKTFNEDFLKISLPEGFLRQIQMEKQELTRIRQQQNTISNIDDNIRRKTQQIIKLRSLVDKFQPYYHKYNQLSAEYVEKCGRLAQKQQEINVLFNQIQQLLKQNENTQINLEKETNEKSKLIKQQQQIQKVNQQIEITFHLYQEECKKKEMGLLKDLEKAYKQITELNKRIDQYEIKVFENQQLKKRLNVKQKAQEKQIKNKERRVNTHEANDNNLIIENLRKQIQEFKVIFISKDDEITKYKILNHELSIQFDKSVNKICEFQKELTNYRRENHELKKIINLFIEKQQYEKLHQKQLVKYQNQKNQSNIPNFEINNQNKRLQHMSIDYGRQVENINQRKVRESI